MERPKEDLNNPTAHNSDIGLERTRKIGNKIYGVIADFPLREKWDKKFQAVNKIKVTQ